MTFSQHPAFDPSTPRERQVALLRNLHANIPYQQRIAAAWTWLAILDPRAVPGCRVALDEMPNEERKALVTRAEAMRS